MKTPTTKPFTPTALRVALDEGMTIISDGPSGVQLIGKKRPAISTRIVMILGLVLLLAYGFGLILIILALLDYARTPAPILFLDRTAAADRAPPPASGPTLGAAPPTKGPGFVQVTPAVLAAADKAHKRRESDEAWQRALRGE